MSRQLEYKPALYALWSYSERKPRVTESIRVSGVWIYSEIFNGARNILAAGHTKLAYVGMVKSGRPSKQELDTL